MTTIKHKSRSECICGDISMIACRNLMSIRIEHITYHTLRGLSSSTVVPHRNRPWKQRSVLDSDMAVEPSGSLVQSNISRGLSS